MKIEFLSSPFDEESCQFLSEQLKCKMIKIPSGEINNFLMLSKINLKNKKFSYLQVWQIYLKLLNV